MTMDIEPANPRRNRVRTRIFEVLIVITIVIVLIALLLPSMGKVSEPVMRMQSSNNLKHLAIGMQNYDEYNFHLPGANAPYLDPKDGSKKFPVSWRVLLLPYIENQKLYDQYRFDEPWDGPNNIQLLQQMPKVYRHPKADEARVPFGHTHYRVFVSRPGAKPSAVFTDGLSGPKMQNIDDGTSNTILIVEAAEAVPWTMPEVLLYDRNQPVPKLGGLFKGYFQVALADGSVRSFRNDFPEDKLRAWITKDGAETVDDDW